MASCNNYNANNTVIHNNNNIGKNGTEFTTVAATNNSARPPCSSSDVMVDKSLMVPGGTKPSVGALPKRDFHFKRIEIEETPKWFVWPKRNKDNKQTMDDKKMNHDESSRSSANNLISKSENLPNPSIAVPAMPQNITNLASANNSPQQNLMEQHNLNQMILTQSGSDNTALQPDVKKHRQYDVQYCTVTSVATNTELIDIPSSESNSHIIPNSEPNSYHMRCDDRISESAPSTFQTFKILSISKKTLENSGDDDDLDPTNYVVSNCRQSHSQPIKLLSRPATTSDMIKEVH
ncbi:unnamed protein product [Onchocerca ochengi]|uniref:Uncharacterized protein n=1 Tax=Onchocerca ochengi TaxID=42157 RepID=A0A182E945_ONCOC|nr:unnamed protein product [Onchocerca ochengi]